MLGIKKQFIKNMIKLEVVANTPGKLQLYIAQIKKADDEYKKYQAYVERGIKLMKGIEDVQVDYEKGLLTIYYNPEVVSVQKVYKWLQVLVDIGIDYYDSLKASWDKNEDNDAQVELFWQKMKPILLTELTKLR